MREDGRSEAIVVDIYGKSAEQNDQQRSQKRRPSARRVTGGEGGWDTAAAAARMDIGRSMGPGTRHDQREAPVAVNGCRPWALAHMMPRPPTVSERLKMASKPAVSGLPFTVSCLFLVLHIQLFIAFIIISVLAYKRVLRYKR